MPGFARLRATALDPPLRLVQNEADLIAAARLDARAFGPLYDRYMADIFGYCFLRLDSREGAEDATSLIFAKALSGLATYRGPSFRGWLFGIAHHVVIDVYRSNRRHLPLDAAADIDDPSASPEHSLLNNESMSTLTAALRHLTPDQRQVIELRLAGLTNVEISLALGRSRGAVNVAQHRAVRRLRELLMPADGIAGREV